MTRTKRDEPAEILPDDLSWAAGGHASDVVLTVLADGQPELVSSAVRAHVERCTTCLTHLGHAALLSLHADRELVARAEHDRQLAREHARRPLPRLAIGLGLAVAALGLVPSLLDGGGSSTPRDASLFLRGLGTLVRRLDEPGSPAGLVITYATALVLIGIGFAVVRALPKKETSR